MVRNTLRRNQRDNSSVRGFFSRWDAELGGMQKDLEEEAKRIRRTQRRLKADPEETTTSPDSASTSEGSTSPVGITDTKAGAKEYLLEWQKHDQAYRKFQEQKIADDAVLCYADIPWPPCAADVLEFLESMWAPGHPRQAYRIACRRWHPDKFLQFYGPKVKLEDRERVEANVNSIFQAISNTWQRMEERRKLQESVYG